MYFDGDNGIAILVGEIYKASKSAGAEYSLQGMCGNYDNNPLNDLEGGDVSKFVDKFRIPDRTCNPPPEDEQNPFEKLSTKEQAEVLAICKEFRENPVFKECRSKVLVDPFHNSCWFSMSLCKLEKTKCDICIVYAQYAISCSLHGIGVEWRTKEFCCK